MARVRGLVAEKSLRKTHNLTNVLRELVVSAAGNTIRRSELDSRAREVLPRQIRPLVLIALNQSGFYRDDGKLTKSGSTAARDVEFQRGRLTSSWTSSRVNALGSARGHGKQWRGAAKPCGRRRADGASRTGC